MEMPILYTVNEALKVLRIGRSLFYSLVKAGEIKVTKIAGKTLVKAVDLEEFIASR